MVWVRSRWVVAYRVFDNETFTAGLQGIPPAIMAAAIGRQPRSGHPNAQSGDGRPYSQPPFTLRAAHTIGHGSAARSAWTGITQGEIASNQGNVGALPRLAVPATPSALKPIAPLWGAKRWDGLTAIAWIGNPKGL